MSKKRQYAKEAIEEAVKFVLGKEGSTRLAALKFGVPRSTIQFKIKNPDTKFKSGPDPVLTELEENSLCKFIIELAGRGFPRKKEDIQLCVQDFLKKNPRTNPFRDDKPGDVWFKAFMKRHPNICFRTSEGVTNASACVSEKDIRKWFQEIREYIDNERLNEVIQDPARVFNADETGFNVCPRSGKVLAEKGSKNVYQIEKGSAKENITVLFTFSAAGQVCKPMIVYPYKRIPDKVSLSVPSGWGIGRSEKGWMTATVFQDYIENCFYPQLVSDKIPLPVILFVDGHKTHLTIEVSELCRNLQIHLIALYPNATRILQPADVAAFRPIKEGWKKGLRKWYAANNYIQSLNKESFAPLLKTVVDASTKPTNLINGFRVTGLYPFDANMVDYSKCIASSKYNQQPEALSATAAENDQNNTSVLTYKEFCGIVGNAILEKCQAATVLELQSFDENFNAIYKLWKKFNDFTEEENLTLDMEVAFINQDNEFLNYGTDDPQVIRDNDDTPSCILDERSGYLVKLEEELNALESIKLPVTEKDVEKMQLEARGVSFFIGKEISVETNTREADKSIVQKEREELAHLNYMESDNLMEEVNDQDKLKLNIAISEKNKVNIEKENKMRENISKIEATPCSTLAMNFEEVTEPLPILNKVEEKIKEKPETENKTIKNTSLIETPRCLTAAENPKPSISQPIHLNKKISVISTESLQEYLKKKMRPISPKRQGKRQTQKLPFALTSDSYVELIKAKQLKKQEDEAAKENRKRLREEKKKQKENVIKEEKKNTNKKQGNRKNETDTSSTLAISPAKKKPKADAPICCDACLSPITRRSIDCSQCNKHFHLNCIPSFHRIHIPMDDDDDAFLCHFCYRECSSELSISDEEDILFSSILAESKKQGF